VWSEDVRIANEKVCRPAAISRCRACCSLLVFFEKFADLVGGNESELFFNLLSIECFRGPREGFIQGLHFVVAVRWEVNCENPGCFVAAHFVAAHSSIAAYILRGPIFPPFNQP
jgi:hypothetical protein